MTPTLAALDPTTVIATAVAATVVAVISWAGQRKHNSDAVERLAQAARPNVWVTDPETGVSYEVPNGYTESRIMQMPWPAWLGVMCPDKYGRIRFVMAYVNDKYAAKYGHTRFQYHGKTHHDVYPKDVADQYHANDMAAIELGAIRTQESTPIPGDGDELHTEEFWKLVTKRTVQTSKGPADVYILEGQCTVPYELLELGGTK
jgi:hypothetical protein